VDFKSRVITLTPVLSVAAYADGDQMGVAMALTDALDNPTDVSTVISVAVVDKASQQTDFDLLLFNAQPTTGANHAPCAISDAEMAAKFLGVVSVRVANYADLTTCSYASVIGLGLMLQGVAGSGNQLWGVFVCRGAPTFTSVSDLVVRVGVEQD